MSAVSSYLLLSSRLLSIHLRLGRPLLLFPGTAMSIICLDKLSSSLLLICPYKFNRFCVRNVDIWHTLASSCMIWFLTWSFLVLPLIHRSILISATCNLFSSFFLTAQHSAPYVIVGFITGLMHLVFQFDGYLFVALARPSAANCIITLNACLLYIFFGLFPIWGRRIECSISTFFVLVFLQSLLVSPSCLFL